MSASQYWTPPSPKPYIVTFPHCHFGAVSHSYLRCCVQILPQIKLNSQLSSCASFLVNSRLIRSPGGGGGGERDLGLLRRKSVQFSSVQSLSRVRLFVTPWIAARQASLSITNSRSLLKLTSIEEEIGVWNSQEGEKDKSLFFPLHSLVLVT